MQYGIPYKGSKNKIAAEIVGCLPAGEVFVDLFAGGCAVTHAAIVSGKYRRFIVNDIQGQYPRLFVDAIRGNLPKPRTYTREEFDAAKATDAIAAVCWSFGNNCSNYLWDTEIEQAKQTACRMILADDWTERLLLFKTLIGQLQEARKEYEYRLKQRDELRAQYGDIETSIREELCRYLSEAGKSRADVDRILGTNGMAGHYFGRSQWEFPTMEAYDKIRDAMPNFPPFDYWGQRLESLESLQSLESLESLQSLQSLESRKKVCTLGAGNRTQTIERLYVRRDFADRYRPDLFRYGI